LQILKEPRLIHETEDVHLLDTFLFSTKMNDAHWRISPSYGHKFADQCVDKDLYAIPERIFKPLEEGNGGHAEGGYEEEYKQIRANSLGKIVSHSKPIYFNDGSPDYYYTGKVKLNSSKTASIMIENGSKTWIPFAVSAHIWPEQGNDDNITKAEFMGLAMVIKGAFGDQAVINKYCSGSAVKCEKSLTAAIQDVINSFNTKENSLNIMSTQQVETSTGTSATNTPENQFRFKADQAQVPTVDNNKEKDITLTKEEYDTLQKQLKDQESLRNEVITMKNERNTEILNQVFADIEDVNIKQNIIEKYFKKESSNVDIAKLVKEVYDDFTAQILPKKIELALKESKEQTKKEEPKSRTASSLKPEPKKEENDTEESKTASVTDEISVNDFLKELGL
jgi:hypothetical protein